MQKGFYTFSLKNLWWSAVPQLHDLCAGCIIWQASRNLHAACWIPHAAGMATQCQVNSCYSLYKGLVPYKWNSSNMCTYTYQQLWVGIWIVVSNVAHIIRMGESNSKCSSKVRAWFAGRQVLVAVPVVTDVGTHTYPSWTSQNSLTDRVHKWLHTWTGQRTAFYKHSCTKQQSGLVKLQTHIIWEGIPWCWVNGSECLKGTYSLHLVGSSSLMGSIWGSTETSVTILF